MGGGGGGGGSLNNFKFGIFIGFPNDDSASMAVKGLNSCESVFFNAFVLNAVNPLFHAQDSRSVLQGSESFLEIKFVENDLLFSRPGKSLKDEFLQLRSKVRVVNVYFSCQAEKPVALQL